MQKRNASGAWSVAALLVFGAAACSSSEKTIVQPTREVVRDRPVTTVQERVVVLREAPPAPKPEVVIVQPAPDNVWVPGYWRPMGGSWEWVSGHWEAPPSGRRVWVPARYETSDSGVVYVEGYWR
jgi:hypothetical protein